MNEPDNLSASPVGHLPPPFAGNASSILSGITAQAGHHVYGDFWPLRGLLVLQKLEANQGADRAQYYAILAGIFRCFFLFLVL